MRQVPGGRLVSRPGAYHFVASDACGAAAGFGGMKRELRDEWGWAEVLLWGGRGGSRLGQYVVIRSNTYVVRIL